MDSSFQPSLAIDTDNKEFQDALNLIKYTTQSVFLTGKAGTGKSTFLKYICNHIDKKHVVLAPTGISAINAGGTTIHSFFKMPFRPMLPDDPDLSTTDNRIFEFLKYRKEHVKLLKNVELIIIDEISMVRADMIDFIDRVLRIYSRNMRQPFGGKQLLFVGDIFQLEPVVTADAKQILDRFYPNSFFFSAKVFSEIKLVPIELRKVYRQNDETFISLLDKIRSNEVTKEVIDAINKRVVEIPTSHPDDFTITLATRRDTVDYINDKHLGELDEKESVFEGEINGDFPENSLPTPKTLVLKIGAQIIFIKNDMERKWVNGTLGIISYISANDKIKVLLENGTEVDVTCEIWHNMKYTYNEKERKIEEKELGNYTQYPMRLAWAITVHKSQGLTFNKVIIDFGGGTFAGGQAYVALSRSTSLEGITLKRALQYSDVFVRKEVLLFSKQFNDRMLIEQSMKEGEADRLYREAIKKFDQHDYNAFLPLFFKAIHARYEIEKPLSQRFIRRKLNQLNAAETTVIKMQKELEEQANKLRQYAYEYYLLGNEAMLKGGDLRAAVANFKKALNLDPKLTDAWIRMGIIHAEKDEKVEAAQCFNEAVKLSPRSFKALYNRGKFRHSSKDYEGAISDYKAAIAANSKNPTVHDRMADLLEEIGELKMAATHRKTAQKLRNLKLGGK